MSASALRYQPRDDRNGELRAKILSLAQRHRRYGVGMIYLKLRQAGHVVNYKRGETVSRAEAAGAAQKAQEGADRRASAAHPARSAR